MSGANTYTGLTTVSGGTLAYGISNAISSGNVTVSGGTLNIGSFSDTVGTVSLTSGSITGTTGVLTSAAAYDMQAGSVSAILAGAVGLNKTTAGTVTLSGANTYTGATTVSQGTLSVSDVSVNAGASNLGNASTAVILGGASTAGTLSYTGAADSFTRGFTVNAGGGTLSNVGTGALTVSTGGIATSGVFTVGGNQSMSISSVISGSGSLTKVDSGSVTLSGTNTFSGATTISGGTLSISNDNNLGAVPASTTLGALSLNGGTLSTTANMTLDPKRGITVGTGGTISTATGTTLTYNGTGASLAGSGTLTKDGAGTLALGLVNNFTGSLTVNSGTVSANELDISSGKTLTIASGATVSLTQAGGTTSSINTLAGAGNLNVSGGTVNLATAFGTRATSLTDGLALTLSGGTLSFSGGGEFAFANIVITGDTTIDFGSGGNTVLSSYGLTIAPGVLVTVNNWVAGADRWISTLAPTINGSSVGAGSAISSSNVTFSGASFSTTWSSSGWNSEIAAVPEPSTYGAMLMAGCAGLLGFRRWRAKRRAAPSAVDVVS